MAGVGSHADSVQRKPESFAVVRVVVDRGTIAIALATRALAIFAVLSKREHSHIFFLRNLQLHSSETTLCFECSRIERTCVFCSVSLRNRILLFPRFVWLRRYAQHNFILTPLTVGFFSSCFHELLPTPHNLVTSLLRWCSGLATECLLNSSVQ